MRQLANYSHGLHAEEALTAVLKELASLRASIASLTDSGIEPPRLVREERDRLRAELAALKVLDAK